MMKASMADADIRAKGSKDAPKMAADAVKAYANVGQKELEARGLELDERRATGRRVLHQPEDLLRAATVNGMRSLGWEAGELKPGMLADFITVEQPAGMWRELNAAYLIYGFSGRDVTNVVVGGNTVVTK
jgi:cytosine/adenosine deaminase-related metal-dependent hydrolase